MTAYEKQPFVALSIAPAANPHNHEFRLLVAQHPEKARPLHELHPPPGTDSRGQSQPGVCEPRVTLQREGERIIGIHILCSCGQSIDLKCSYPQASPA